MSDVKTVLEINNCNNITSGSIDIFDGKLNILFGRNGTSKSAIVKAVGLKSNNKPLSALFPYGLQNDTAVPSVEGMAA